MIVFGWIMLLVVTIYVTVVTIFGVVATKMLSGEIEKGCFIFLILDFMLIWATYYNFPFTILTK